MAYGIVKQSGSGPLANRKLRYATGSEMLKAPSPIGVGIRDYDVATTC